MMDIDTLVEEANRFPELAKRVQDDSYSEEARRAFLRELRARYEDWHLRAVRLISSYDQPGEVEKFNKEYRGGFLGGKIAGFLREGTKANILYNPDEPIPGLDEWQQPFEQEFTQPLFNQLSILAGLRRAAVPQGSSGTAINIYGGTNTLASGRNFTQQVRVEDVRPRDLDSLLGFLGNLGVTREDLERLTEAIEADERAQAEGGTPSKVGEWAGRITGTVLSAGVTGASSEATLQIIRAIAGYYGVELGG
jgi:hypothetical protein